MYPLSDGGLHGLRVTTPSLFYFPPVYDILSKPVTRGLRTRRIWTPGPWDCRLRTHRTFIKQYDLQVLPFEYPCLQSTTDGP